MRMWFSIGASQKLVLCALWLVSSQAKDTNGFTVTCTDSEQCVLPCQFQSDGKGARIMWYRKGAIVSCTRYGDTSFVIGSSSQVDSYKGRTVLFADQVLEGNAALVLQNVTPHDQDKYFCVTMTAPHTDQSGVVSLIIKAPVRTVDISFRDGVAACSSERIYPRPSLVWSTDPPTEAGRLPNRTIVKENSQGFYDIESTLQLKEANLTRTYICRVATDTNHRTAFLNQQAPILACPGTSVTVPCSVPFDLTSYNVTWTFGRRERVMSLTVTEQQPRIKVDDRWKPHVSADLQSRGGLTLVELKSEHHGTYICEVNTKEETHATYTELIVQQDSVNVSVYVSVCCILVLLAMVLILTYKRHTFKEYVRGVIGCGRVQKGTAGNGEPDVLRELRCSHPETK